MMRVTQQNQLSLLEFASLESSRLLILHIPTAHEIHVATCTLHHVIYQERAKKGK